MASDRLYQLALEFRKASLWKRMEEDQLFAVQLPGERIGYVSVMGHIGEHLALALYAGEEGLRSYHILREFGVFNETDYSPAMLNNMSVQVSYEARNDLPEESLAEARSYLKRNGIRLHGRNAYPMFFKAEKGVMMTSVLMERDEEDLAAALEAAIEVAKDKALSYRKPGDFPGIDRQSRQIVLVEKTEDSWNRRNIPLPTIEDYRPPEGGSYDELAAARILKLPKRGAWQAGLISVPIGVEWEHSDELVLPVFLLTINVEKREPLDVRPVGLYETRPHVMLNMFMQAIEEYGSRPVTIEVEDEYTEALLRKWSSASGTRLVRKESLPELQNAKWGLLNYLRGAADPEYPVNEMLDLINALLLLSDEELAAMPEDLKDQLFDMEDELEFAEFVPEQLLGMLEELNDRIEELDVRSDPKAGAGKGRDGFDQGNGRDN